MMMLGGPCSNNSNVWTRLLLLGSLLAFERWCTLVVAATITTQAQEVHQREDDTEPRHDESCAAVSTVSQFNLVVEPQFGGGGNINKRCKDENAKCASWSQAGECMQNPVFMLVTCAISCRSCLSVTGRYGVEQVVQSLSDVLEEYMVTQRMHDYMIDVVYQDDSFQAVKNTVRK
jgi:ShK domain-like